MINAHPTSGRLPDLHPAADARSSARLGLAVLAVAVGGIGAWAGVATLSSAIIAPGYVRVEDNRKSVQHREGGIVKEILVKEGERVAAGQALIVLGDERVAADLDGALAALDAESAKAARLEAQSTDAGEVRFPPFLAARGTQPSAANAMQVERAAFQSRRSALREQLALLESQCVQTRHEIDALQAQARAKEAATALLREEVRTHEALSREGFVSRMRVVRVQRDLQDYESQRNEFVSNIARARQRLAELSMRANALSSQSRQGAADELPQVRARIATLEQQLRSSRDSARRQSIVAPIAGSVVDLKVFTAGGVVAAGAPLMDIVPDDNRLIVEARLNVDDVTHVGIGSAAEVRLTAYPHRNAPLLKGEVRNVSADRISDPSTRTPYYSAQIAIDAQSLRSAPDVRLQPGMAAEVYLLAGEHTPLQYLLEPIRNGLRRALRQPS
jgi:HlyD family type I secretion membrane fusion protein